MLRVIGAFVCGGGAGGTAVAQELRGQVLLPDHLAPASGIVAVFLHPTQDDSIVARAVTNERGRFVLKAPAGAAVRLRFLRIGYEAVQAGSFTLAAGEIRDTSFTLTEMRVQLAAMDVKAVGRCDVQPKGALLVAQLFEQARTALIATTSDVMERPVMAQFVDYRRQQDRRGRLSAPLEQLTHNAPTLRPYSAVNVDTLDRYGYVTGDVEASDYFAPDANVLISDTFLKRHCLQLVPGKDSTSVGIGFVPVGKRADIVDVKGTLWLDRATSELQFLEYTYESLPAHLRNSDLGGRVSYAHTADGGWFISQWFIQMPVVTSMKVAASAVPGLNGFTTRLGVAGHIITGGAVQHIRQGHEVLYVDAGAQNAGASPGDEAEGVSGGGNATDRMASPANGATGLRATSSSEPMMGAASCAYSAPTEYAGVVSGRVVDKQGAQLSGQMVRAEWNQSFERFGTGIEGLRWSIARAETRSAGDGSYALCGVPYDRAVRVQVGDGSSWNRGMIVRVAEAAPVLKVDLTSSSVAAPAVAAASAAASAAAKASLNGSAAPASEPTPGASTLQISNVNGWPLPYAVVEFAENVVLVTDASGMLSLDARSRSDANTNGMLSATVRSAGYAPFSGLVMRQPGENTFLLSLTQANTSSDTARAKVTQQLEAVGFYRRLLAAQAALGASTVSGGATKGRTTEFITPEELDENRNVGLSQLLASRRSLRVTKNKGFTVLRANTGCLMAVAVNGARVPDLYDGQTVAWASRTIDDVMQRDQVRAVEIFADAAAVPAELRQEAAEAACGLVAIWTGAH